MAQAFEAFALRAGPFAQLLELGLRDAAGLRLEQRLPEQQLARHPELEYLEFLQPAQGRIAGQLAVELKPAELVGDEDFCAAYWTSAPNQTARP
jgi:hypothetical protein